MNIKPTIKQLKTEIVSRTSVNQAIFPFLIVIVPLLIIMPSRVFPIVLLQSLAFQALILMGILSVVFLIVKKRKMMYASVFAFIALLCYLYPYLRSNNEVNVKPADFQVAHFNVLFLNNNYDKTINKALASNAGFLSFQEINKPWISELTAKLSEEYPYHKIVYGSVFDFGIAVFSKWPLANLDVKNWYGVPNIVGDIVLDTGSVHFVASHTRSPVSPWRLNNRNKHIKKIAEYIANHQEKPLIAIGDYNAVPWDACIQSFRARAGVNDSRKSLTPTFPAWLPFAQIPIDYIFHTKDVDCLEFKSLPGTASDHLGILGTYQIKKR